MLKSIALQLDELQLEEDMKKKTFRPDNIDLIESSDKEMRIVAGPNEHYQKGSEVYMSYGRYSNRQLLSTYGFALITNRYSFSELKIQLKKLTSSLEISERLRMEEFTPDVYVDFKLKENILCKSLLNILRKLWWIKEYPINAFFKPNIIEFELKILDRGIKLLNEKLESFPTSYEEDKEIIKEFTSLRKYFAVRDS